MELDALHGIIDDTQMENPKTEFTVSVVDENGMKPYHITEVYVDTENGMLNLVFNSKERE
jgi:hypothetical protein